MIKQKAKGMNRLLLVVILAVVSTLLVTGCASNGELVVRDPWIRPGVTGGNTAAYFTIDNSSGQADTLLAAVGDIAGQVEIHLSKTNPDGVMMMEPQEAVPVARNTAVQFAPGGLHIMFVGLKQDLRAGDRISLRLQFEEAGEIVVTVPVEDR